MFEFVQKRKYLTFTILTLLTIPFAFFGVQSYTRSIGGSDDVAKVDGVPITQREFTEELRRQQDRLRSVLGRGADLSSFDTPASRRALLDSMIAEQLVGHAALKANLTVSDDDLRDIILSTAAFQSGGRFSMTTYEAVLRSQNMTPAEYEARLRYQMARGELTQSIAATAIASRSVTHRLVALEEQKREIAESRISSDAYLSKVKVEEAALKRFYDEHQADYRVPERVRAEYVVLSASELGHSEPVTDAEIKAAYEAHALQYQVGEQRRASHILIQVAADADKAAKAAALKKAEKILAEVRKNPKRFAELAKKYSQDPGSASKGGDLGYFGRGMMVKPFEDAAFALKLGQTSGIVHTDFGYHIIELTGIRPARAKPLADVRAQLMKEIQRQKGLRKFNEAAEAFSNMVYEQADSLKPAADRFKLEIKTTDWITRASAKGLGTFDNRRLVDALFSSDAITAKHNTDAIEVAPNTLVAARVVAHEAARQRGYDEVKADVERRLRLSEAAKLAEKAGEALLARLSKGDAAGLKWGPTQTVSRRDTRELDPRAVRPVFSADTSKLPAYAGVDLGDKGYAIYRIARVIPPAARSDAQVTEDVARRERQVGLSQYEAYIESLRSQADVKINEQDLGKQP